MNTAVGVRTPAAALTEIGQGETANTETIFSRLKDAMEKSRHDAACRVIVKHAHLLPPDHPWRSGPHGRAR